MFKMLNYKMDNLVSEKKQVVVVLSFPRRTSDLEGYILFLFEWFNKALQFEIDCFSISFTGCIKHTV